jgi:hypothetical protein
LFHCSAKHSSVLSDEKPGNQEPIELQQTVSKLGEQLAARTVESALQQEEMAGLRADTSRLAGELAARNAETRRQQLLLEELRIKTSRLEDEVANQAGQLSDQAGQLVGQAEELAELREELRSQGAVLACTRKEADQQKGRMLEMLDHWEQFSRGHAQEKHSVRGKLVKAFSARGVGVQSLVLVPTPTYCSIIYYFNLVYLDTVDMDLQRKGR